ncbi:hypothetical protein [Asticcacaulis endophyticus]|uniref:SCP domain-containing protein n=1 Tax=Asticcacaulis endophyticus TaxID=1395890 RepID=A0A918PRA9_9CAUL|nr:hypothetical protein [Asticcacaulis endophyticus]GGZ20290.1 hypothetical protein GCM10011273_01080 [Asticcacaulis endophyticus]
MSVYKVLSALIIASGLMSGAAHAAAPSDMVEILTRRQFMLTADKRCHLLDAPAVTALNAGLVQSRNQLVRAGISATNMRAVLNRARDAGERVDCASSALQSEAETVRGAYRAFVAQPRLELPSDRTHWQATRSHASDRMWRLVQHQDSRDARLAFGLYGTLTGFNLTVMAQFTAEETPYGARLLLRDPRLNPTGVITRGGYTLSRDLPKGFSETYSRSFMASGRNDLQIALGADRRVNFAGFDPSGKRVGTIEPKPTVRFDFPREIMTAMAGLDPREDVIIAFDFQDGPRYARFEIGDFITGAGFIALPSPYGQ